MDLHAWITQQVDRVADEAHEAAGGAGSEHWQAAETASCECCINLRTKDGGLLCTPDSRYVDFMATHDPAAVLRRCEADRRILARHCLDPARADSWMFAAACMGCGTEGTFEEPVAENLNDCPELLDLAHAHGLTDEILAGLDRPQPPEAKPLADQYANGGTLTPPITTSDVPVDPDGYPLKIRVEPDFETFREQVQDEIRRAQADVTHALREAKQLPDSRESTGRPMHPNGTPYNYSEITAGGWHHCSGCRTWGQWTAEKPHDCINMQAMSATPDA